MAPTGKGQSHKHEHWQEIPRNKKGRWVKRSKNTKTSSSMPVRQGTSALGAMSIKTVADTLDNIQKKFDTGCPRCSGQMKTQSIRCGPDRLIQVKKCEICNFWLPSTST